MKTDVYAELLENIIYKTVRRKRLEEEELRAVEEIIERKTYESSDMFKRNSV